MPEPQTRPKNPSGRLSDAEYRRAESWLRSVKAEQEFDRNDIMRALRCCYTNALDMIKRMKAEELIELVRADWQRPPVFKKRGANNGR